MTGRAFYVSTYRRAVNTHIDFTYRKSKLHLQEASCVMGLFVTFHPTVG